MIFFRIFTMYFSFYGFNNRRNLFCWYRIVKSFAQQIQQVFKISVLDNCRKNV